jgi:hypothetical protein
MFIIENTILNFAYGLIFVIRTLFKGDLGAQCSTLLRLVAPPLAFTYVLGYTCGELYHKLFARVTERFA